MYTNLLVPTDGTKLSDKAVTQAIALAQALKAKLTVFHASPDYPMPVYAEGVSVEMISRREYTKRAKEDAQKVLDRVAAKAAVAGVDVTGVHAIAASPWWLIVPQNPHSRFRVCGMLVLAIGAAPTWRGLVPCA